MNIYLMLFILLSTMIGSFYLVNNFAPSNYRPIPIVTHLLFCCTLLPLFFFAVSYFGFQIPMLKESPFLGSFNQSLGAIVLCIIMIELSDIKPNIDMVKVATSSAILPAIGAIIFAICFGYITDITLTTSLIGVFALSAVPVLYIYLKQINANQNTITLFMGAAILIDIVVWTLFNLVSTTFNLVAFCTAIILSFAPLLVKKINRGDFNIWSIALSLFFFFVFTSLHFSQSYALIFAILFFYNMKKYLGTSGKVFSSLPEHWLLNFFNYFAIPMLFICSSLSISWHTLDFKISYLETSIIIILPIILKTLGSFIGLKLVNYHGDKLLGSLLLNSRGLTEVVFINTLFTMHIISPIMYISLLLMTLIATLIPGIVVKFQMNRTVNKVKLFVVK